MAQIGNKINSWLNGEWARHVRRWGKSEAAGIRRMMGKAEIRRELALNSKGRFEEDYSALIILDGVSKSKWIFVEHELMNRYMKRDIDKQLYGLEELCVLKKAA